MRKLTQEEFIEKAKRIHGDKYDYSKVEYKDSRTKIQILCKTCNTEFLTTPNNHLRGYGCMNCSGKKKLTQEEFIEKARQVHGDKYEYSKVEYKNNATKVCIICPEHGEFWTTPNNHLRGQGCLICYRQKRTNNIKWFIAEATKIHGDKYDYSKADYINVYTKVCIICPEHGEFWQRPEAHLNGCGCPKCKCSKGEQYILEKLVSLGIQFKTQQTFDDCKDIKPLPFDFYLPDYNLCIEYQGKQHFILNEFFGGEKEFYNRLKHDNIKREWCSKPNNPDLLEICSIAKPFTEKDKNIIDEAIQKMIDKKPKKN